MVRSFNPVGFLTSWGPGWCFILQGYKVVIHPRWGRSSSINSVALSDWNYESLLWIIAHYWCEFRFSNKCKWGGLCVGEDFPILTCAYFWKWVGKKTPPTVELGSPKSKQSGWFLGMIDHSDYYYLPGGKSVVDLDLGRAFCLVPSRDGLPLQITAPIMLDPCQKKLYDTIDLKQIEGN